MKIGAIVVITKFLNNQLITELTSHCEKIILVTFGLKKEECIKFSRKYSNFEIFFNKKKYYRNRKYIILMTKYLKTLYSHGCEYYLCIHGESGVIKNIDSLFEEILSSPFDNIIEQNKQITKSTSRFNKFYFGVKPITMFLNIFLKNIIPNRFRSVGFCYGHDSWGLSKTTVEYILFNNFAKFMYALSIFSLDCKNFYFHTLAYHSNVTIKDKSLERYSSNNFKDYDVGYSDHSEHLFCNGTGIFYPVSSQFSFNLNMHYSKNILNNDNNILPEIFKPEYPSFLTENNRYNKNTRIIIYSNEIYNNKNILEQLNTIQGVICHGFIDKYQCIDYLNDKDIVPGYSREEYYLRDMSISQFITNLENYYKCKCFAFCVDLSNKNNFLNLLWTNNKYISIFIIPDIIYNNLECEYSVTNKKIQITSKLLVKCNSTNLFACYDDQFYLVKLLNQDLKPSNKIIPPLIIPVSLLHDVIYISQLKQKLIDLIDYLNIKEGE